MAPDTRFKADRVRDLLSALAEAGTLLREAREAHWAAWLEKDSRLIAGGDFHGMEHLLRAFGGMGSLNDVVLADPGKDARLKALLGGIYDRAVALKRDHQRT